MPLVSINILTKNRSQLLRKALDSVFVQSFLDYEVIVVNDGSTDDTAEVLAEYQKNFTITVITHKQSKGIILSRQEVLEKSSGEYIALLDDDDEWIDNQKLVVQVEWFKQNPVGLLIGGGIKVDGHEVYRATSDAKIKITMLLRNNFFTSTVMFKKSAAVAVGGFISDGIDVAEDYDLWLRMGHQGQMGNFRRVFTAYRAPVYTKERKRLFFTKQLNLIKKHSQNYPFYWLSRLILLLRIYV